MSVACSEDDSGYGPIEPRAPQKQEPSRASLSILGMELILIIFDMVSYDCPETINSLALVSSHYHYAARYCQCRKLSFDVSGREKESLQRRLNYIEKAGFQTAIRRIKVCGDEDDQENLDAVVQLLKKATGLRKLVWLNNGPPRSSIGVPDDVVAALQSRSLVRLHTSVKPVAIRTLNTPPPNYTTPLTMGCDNLHSLRMCFTYTDLDGCIEIARIVKQILLSSPNVRILAIDVGYPTGGCVRRGPPRRYSGLGFDGGERPPALEELELARYDFGFEAQVDLNGPFGGRGSHVGYPGKGMETDYWVNTFDWSRLKRLRTKHLGLALKLAPKLASLEEASFNTVIDSKDAQQFYDTVPNPLSTIKIPRFDALGIEGILRHASRLKILHIHQNQSRDWSSQTIDATSLLKIQQECPLIEELVLDINRQDDWPYDVLEILAGFKKLHSLTIWFELGWIGREPTNAVQPPVTYSAVEKILSYLQSRRSSTFTPLKLLKVHCGCAAPFRGYPSPNARWPRNNQSTYICQLSDRDDEAPKGVFSMTCPRLTEDEKVQLSKRRKNGEDIPSDLTHGVSLVIHGPPGLVSLPM